MEFDFKYGSLLVTIEGIYPPYSFSKTDVHCCLQLKGFFINFNLVPLSRVIVDWSQEHVFPNGLFSCTDLILTCPSCGVTVYSEEASGMTGVWLGKYSHFLCAERRKVKGSIVMSTNSEMRFKMSLLLNFPQYQSLSGCHSALIIPFCQKYFILSVAPQLHYIIINSESKKIREVTKHFQGYLCFSFLPFKSSWAVVVCKLSSEDLFSVSWGKKKLSGVLLKQRGGKKAVWRVVLIVAHKVWIQKSRLLFSSLLHNISIFLSLNAACSAGAAGRFIFFIEFFFCIQSDGT